MNYKDIMQSVQNSISPNAKAGELEEYKQDFIGMNIGSIKTIYQQAKDILLSLQDNDEVVKNNLTESWLQGKIAVVEDGMNTVYNFVKNGQSNADKAVSGCGCGKNKRNNANQPDQSMISQQSRNPRNNQQQIQKNAKTTDRPMIQNRANNPPRKEQ